MATTSFLSKTQLALLFIIPSILSVVNSQTTYISHLCFAPYTYLTDFESNIDKATTQLTLEASNTYFSTNTTGLGQDQVNAFFYCRYDVSLQTCQDCVKTASNKMASFCLSSVEGIINYEECSLHYANLSLSTIMVELPRYVQASRLTANLEIYFTRVLGDTVKDLIGNVTSEFPVSSRYFATTTAKYGSETIYALAQCIPDISSVNCSACLRNGFNALTTNYTGAIYGQFFSSICRLSYISSNEVLSRPWKFSQTLDRPPIFSEGTRESSVIGAVMTSISIVALCLKLLL